MESIGIILSSSTVVAIGWTVIHSLWQISVIVLLYYLISIYGAVQKPRHKYVLAYSALLLQLITSITTFLTLYQPLLYVTSSATNAAKEPAFFVMKTAVHPLGVVEQIKLLLEPLLPLIVTMWVIGMVFFFIRLLLGYAFWQQVRYKNTFPLPEEWRNVFQAVKNRMKIDRRVEVAFSSMIASPVLIGHFKPIVLLPLALVNQLTINQVEGIIAHELAHLRRYDFILNVVQLFIESIFYYHPAIWWLGQQIRSLREDCADDLALEHTNDSMTYARTLLRVAEQGKVSRQSLVMGLLGQNKKHLLTRIQRILQQPIKQPDMREKFAITSLLLLLAVAISLGAAWSSPLGSDFENYQPQVMIDTLPKGVIRIKVNDNGEKMEVTLKGGEIQSLSINGENVPADEFANYEKKVGKILKATPPPPPPPPPPSIVPPSPPPPPFPDSRIIYKKIEEEGDNRRVKTFIDEPIEGEEHQIKVLIEDNDDGGMFYYSGMPPTGFDEIHIWVDSINGEMQEIIVNIDGNDIEVISPKGLDFEEYDSEKYRLKIEEIKEREAKHEVRMAERQVQMEAREKQLIERKIQLAEREVQLAKRMEERSEKMEERMKDLAEEHGNRDQWLEQELLLDGLIKNTENYTIKLNSKKLKINGKTTSDEFHEKYMNLYQKNRGLDFSNKTSINVTKKGDYN